MKTVQVFIGATLLLTLALAKSHLPEQVHLSLGTNETEMLVTWVTHAAAKDQTHVEFGSSKSNLNHKATAEEQHFKDGSAEFHTFRALMTGLTPGSTYYYRVGSSKGWSSIFHFRTFPSGANWNPKLCIYGDLGYKNAQSTPFLAKEVEHDHFDAIFHIGDFAYDLDSNDGERGNQFMNMIQPIASRLPYLTCTGNHEKHGNFSHYDARFSMIGDRFRPITNGALSHRLNNHFHSMTIGPATIIMFSTEFYYFTQFGWDQIRYQYHWLEEELKRANANRAQHPWIIVMGHRPMYCLKKKSKADGEDSEAECDLDAMERPILRKGIHMNGNSKLQYGLEDLFFNYGVDLQFYGHEHHYGRLLPLYNQEIKSGHRSANPYDNPSGPIHIVTGSAGNKQEHGNFNKHPKNWLAYHALDYGYTRLTFKDRSHIILEQTSDEKHGEVIDKIEIIKHQDRPQWMP